MSPDQTVAVNSDRVAAKVMDGEAILINLNNGVYYSTGGVGGFLWELLERGYSLEACAEELGRRFELSQEQALTDVTEFCSTLLAEEIVRVEEVSRRELEGGMVSEDGTESKATYHAPELHIYRDMGDLLALDPPAPDLDFQQ